MTYPAAFRAHRRGRRIKLRVDCEPRVCQALERCQSVLQILLLGALGSAEDEDPVFDVNLVLLEVVRLRLQPAPPREKYRRMNSLKIGHSLLRSGDHGRRMH